MPPAPDICTDSLAPDTARHRRAPNGRPSLRRSRSLIALALLLACGCGGAVAADPGDTGVGDSGAGAKDVAAAPDASVPPIDTASDTLREDAADSAATTDAVEGHYSICNGKPCRGLCIAMDGPEKPPVCWCGGLDGGCPAPLVCCPYRGGCNAKCD